MNDFARNDRLVNKKFMEFLFPSIFMAMSSSLSIIVDSMIVGNVLGNQELAAMNLIMPLSLCFTAVTAIFGIGSSICIAAHKGKMQDETADKCVSLSFFAWCVCSIIAVCLGILLTEQIAEFLAGSSGLKAFVAEYLKVYLMGAPFTFVTMIFPHIIRTDGKPKLASNVLIIANATNLGLDIVFMKFMGMGLFGGALATICGYALGTALYLSYVFSPTRTLHLTRIGIKDFHLYAQMIKMSVSSILGQGFMFAKLWIFNMIIAKLAGQAGLTAFSVCTSCLSFVSMFIAGAAQTMMPMVGAFKGSGDDMAIEMTVKKAFKTVLICCVVTTVLFELFPTYVLGLFGVSGGMTLKLGKIAVRLFSLAFVGIGSSFLFMYYMQASGRPAFSLQICALEGFLFIVPIGIFMAGTCGITGFWLSYTLNEILVILFVLAKSANIVKKSEGVLYSAFMLKKGQGDRIEMSVDVSKKTETEAVLQELMSYIKMLGYSDNDGRLEKVLECIFELSAQAYEINQKKEQSWMVDVIAQKGRVTFKDAGKSYVQLPQMNEMLQREQTGFSYEYTLMLGMNYSELCYGE